MKVYIVMWSTYEQDYISEVFMREKKAQEYIKQQHTPDDYYIEEFKVTI